MRGLRRDREMQAALTTPYVAERLSAALRKEVAGEVDPIKRIARLARSGVRAAKHWWRADNVPHAVHLIALMRESDEVFKAVCELAERDPETITERQKAAIRAALKALDGEE